jgi:hypothetical protein
MLPIKLTFPTVHLIGAMNDHTGRFPGMRIAKAATASFGHRTPIITPVIPTPATEALATLPAVGHWFEPSAVPDLGSVLIREDPQFGPPWYTLFLIVAEMPQ